MAVQGLLGRARDAGVRVEPTDHGTLCLSGRRPPQELLDELRCSKADVLTFLQSSAIGADLIPRTQPEDIRYAGVDLVARGRDVAMLRLGTARLSLTPDDLSPQLRSVAERIALELRAAGPETIGRWATDVVYAYGEVPDLPEPVQVAAYHAWSLDLDAIGVAAAGEDSPTLA
jgi:hypothetical protein